MSSIKDRIYEIIETKGMNPYTFEKKAGLSNGYLKAIKEDIGSSKLEIILRKFPDISPDWLILGEGEMLRQDGIRNYQSAQGAAISQNIVTERPVCGDAIAALTAQLQVKDDQFRALQAQAAALTELLHHVMCGPKPEK